MMEIALEGEFVRLATLQYYLKAESNVTVRVRVRVTLTLIIN